MKDCKRSQLGSKREIRPGVWQVRVTSGTRADGRRRTVSRTVHGSEVEASAAIVQIAADMGKCLTAGDEMSLDAYFYVYFLPEKQLTTTRANADTYRTIYRCHIAPVFGSWPLSRIGNLDIQRWINGLPTQSAPAYVRALRAILNAAHFDHAKLDAPMKDYSYRMPKGRRKTPLPVWGAGEVARALELLDGTQLYALWLCMVGCGLSRSEALALDWGAITWAEMLGMDGKPHHVARVTICAACTSTDGMKEPKNDRRFRAVPMQPPFSDCLYSVRGSGPICQSKRHTKDGYQLTGKRLTPDYIPKLWRAYFEPGGPLHGLPFVQINRMRATYSTMMQRAGVDGSIINAMQGRTDNSPILYSNYLSPQIDTYAESAAAMSRLVSGA